MEDEGISLVPGRPESRPGGMEERRDMNRKSTSNITGRAVAAAVLLAIALSCRPRADCTAVTTAPASAPLPLHALAQEGNLEELKGIKGLGKDINLANSWGWTPLFFAVINGHSETAEFLLKNGSCVNVRTPRGGHTPLHYAASYGYDGIARILIREGADINARDSYDNTPLHLAASGSHLDAVSLLVRSGALLNGKNNRGWTPLHISAWEKNRDITGLLIRSGADHTMLDIGNKTPFDLAELRSDDAIIALFKEKKSEGKVKKEAR